MTFYPGMQVVCVDDKVPLENGAVVKDAQITEGQVYTVRWCGMAHQYVVGDYYGIKLVGVDSKFGAAYGTPDAPYNARRFRPVQPIEIFRAIAADPRQPVQSPEGPVRGLPDGGGNVKEREKEEV